MVAKRRSTSNKIAFGECIYVVWWNVSLNIYIYILLGTRLANMMENLNEEADANISGTATIDLTPEIEPESTSNNQNQTRISFPTVSWSSILDNAM
jgi:hypothetical protein